jgi:flagellar protein FlgJ
MTGISGISLDNGVYTPFAAAKGTGRDPAPPSPESFAELLEKKIAGEKPEELSPKARPVIDKTSKLYEVCQDLETLIVKNLINGMRATVQKSGLLDTGFAGKMYEDMLYDEYAKDFTKSAGLGFADMAYLELTHQRGKAMAQQSK